MPVRRPRTGWQPFQMRAELGQTHLIAKGDFRIGAIVLARDCVGCADVFSPVSCADFGHV